MGKWKLYLVYRIFFSLSNVNMKTEKKQEYDFQKGVWGLNQPSISVNKLPQKLLTYN